MCSIPRLAEFSAEMIPLTEVVSFYQLTEPQHVAVPLNRPYTWSNTVTSLDGVISFVEPGTSAGKEIALGHIVNSGSGSDWRLLNGSWMFADAVMTSGANVRNEHDLLCTPQFEDMQKYRINTLKKQRAIPLQVVLTKCCDIKLTHSLFTNTAAEKLILTSVYGHKQLINQSRTSLNLSSQTTSEEVESEIARTFNIRIKVISELTSDGHINLHEAWKYLRERENIQFLDVSCGGIVLANLVQQQLIDEYRFTISGAVFGHTNSQGVHRPLMFDQQSFHFTLHNFPLLQYVGIRTFGNHHLFIRGVWQYRHAKRV